MSVTDIQWDQVGLGVAALVVLVMVVRIMRGQTDKLLSHTEETTDKVLNFFGNHMTENVKQQAETVKQQAETTNALRELTGAVKDLREDLKNRDA